MLSWWLSNTVDARFCVETLADVMECYGRPQIFNTDQGSQFTSIEFTGVLRDVGVAGSRLPARPKSVMDVSRMRTRGEERLCIR